MNEPKLTARLEIEINLNGIDKSLLESFLNTFYCINILFQIGKNDKLFPNSENYFFNKIIDILNEGTLNLDHGSKVEVQSQIQKISNGIYDMSSISYQYSGGKEIELIFGKIFSPENSNKKLYGGVLATTDFELSRTVDKFDSLTQKIYDEFEFDEAKPFQELKSDFRCMDVISFAGELDRKEKPISVFYSGGSLEELSSLSKVAVFSNIYYYRFKIISGELGKRFIKNFEIPDDKILKQVLICWLRGHDVGHSFGEDNLGAKMKNYRKEYYILHELKSDIISLYLLKRISNELFNKDIIREVYLAFIAEMLRYIRRGQFYKLPDSGSAYLAYKYLSEFEALTFNKSDQKFNVDFEKVDDFVETFSKSLISLFAESKKEEALGVVNKWGEIKDKESQNLPDELNSLGDNSIPYYLELITHIT